MPQARFSFTTVLRATGCFGFALLLGAVLGSLLQSQLNLSAIAELSGPISWQDKRGTMWFDLQHFMPVLAGLMLLPLLLAVLLAGWLRRRQPMLPRSLYFLLAALGFYLTLLLVNQFAPMPTLLAANRTARGTLGLLAACGLAGWCFAWLNERLRSKP
ncbi:hypothetical protein WG68_08425 [Arsukibacterium ikkense]|uniref:Uncharacterized protein n=1 Tax=Arsukibacterium ikkense TaxID=336831 RepID=A0A0M2V996_9GAMM|nr:hypothetical protein [Arsukibacterium ikkense]KKO45733.1 hypothetical protein WG68_08425 [Arsukibacterium ikkense]